jgi:hypothetical protein
MKRNPISYDTTLTLPEGCYQQISHESNNFGLYIDANKKIKLLIISDIALINTGSIKTISLFNENNNQGIRLIDIDVDLNSVISIYNSQSLVDILEDKNIVKQIYDFSLDQGNYEILDSLISDGEIIELYFYNVKNKDDFFNSFENNFKYLLENKDNENDIEIELLFQVSNLTYFDIFPFIEQLENNQNLDIIPGCNLTKLDVLVKNI